ncbi:MAG: hypothetical protein GXY52_01420 [Chloroflexi bacterium]|nr:hypothetical protein [Chloroflexota bacterium]
MANRSWQVTFTSLPQNLAELQQLLEASLSEAYYAAALAVAAFCRYPDSREDALAMLDYLNGPKPLSNYDKQFIADRLTGKEYVPRSYLVGATPTNNYQPSEPLRVVVEDNPYSYDNQEQGYIKLYLRSGGADSPRPVTLRLQPSSGRWFLWEQLLLADIRKPVQEDPWA